MATEGGDLNLTEDNFVPTARCIQDTKERQLLPGLVFKDYGVVYAISTTSRQCMHLLLFDNFAKQYFKVDVIAGDANAAANKYYKKQECQDLHNSSVAVMLREIHRAVNAVRTFESRIHVDYSTNNHSSQLTSAGDLDCCFMAILSWRTHLDPEL